MGTTIRRTDSLQRSGVVQSGNFALVPRPLALAVTYALVAGAAPVWAGPAGEQIVAGQAAVSRAGANTLITQTSDRAAINWQSFSIGAGEAVRFAQPSASSVVLNRVVGQNPSEILGSLAANGQVFLLNPNGVLFGKGAQVDVGGLVASTLNISNSDFLAGRYRFMSSGLATGTAEVVNAGTIIANGGYVALIGPQVKNSGNIVATGGSVALAAGEQVTLNLNGNKLIGLTVDQGSLNALAENKGLIKADGGLVLLTAKAADHLIKAVVNNAGIIEAATLKTVNGVIRLEGDNLTNSGTLRADGEATRGGSIALAGANDITLTANSILSASGARGGDITVQAHGGTLLADGSLAAVGGLGSGGTVKLLGERVGLMANTSVDASGQTGGGTVLVGGDYQGKNAIVQNAKRTYVDASANIKADAVSSGDGGNVIVWANDITRFYGNISAKGGAVAGNGGMVEVSGKGTLDFNGVVNTFAPNGRTGTLLLDPLNIEVVAGGTATLTQVDAFADPDLTGSCVLFGGAACSKIAPATINAAVATVTLQATNNITFTNAISIATAGVGLNATATTGTINVNAAIAVSKSGAVTLTGGSVASTSAGTITTTGAAGLAGGNVAITSTVGAVTLAGTITANGGAGGAGQVGGNAGSVSLKGATTVTTAAITATGGKGGTGAGFVGGKGGSITVDSNGTLVTGALQANGGAGGGTTAAGGNAGTIAVTNLAAAGTLTTTTLTASAGAAIGAVLSGTAGSVSVKNTANTLLQVGAIDTRGQAGGDGGSVSLISTGSVTVTSTIQSGGGALNVGTTAAGRSAGNITLSGGVGNKVTGAISASGGAGLGTNQAGGKASVVSITGTGVLSTAAITASTGAATGTGAGGTAGSITLSGSTATTGALTTTGGSNGAGGNISVTSTTGATTINGAVASSGGAAIAAVAAGSNAGKIIINSAGDLTGAGLTLNASGSNATGANLAGGNGALIDIDATGTITLGNIAASGGKGVATNAAGGNAGAIAITNNSVTTGAITTGTLTARTGAAVGTGAGGIAGSIVVINNAAGKAIDTTAIDSSGQTSGAGGDVTLNGKGNITVTGTLNTFGAALGAGTTAAGRSAGNITFSGGIGNKVTGTITASGGAGLGTNQAGGKAAAVSIAGTGVLSTAAITASSGAATGTGTGGTAGSITLSGSTVTTTALTTTGGSNGAGGNISVTGTSGAVTIGGAITSSGGNSLAAAVAGGTAGAISVDAGGATPTITLAGNLTAAGGNKSGAGTDGSGVQIRLMDAVLLNAATVTISALGGSAGTGIGGNVLFDGAVDSTGGARILVVNTNANTVFGGAAGAISPLQTLTTDTKGTTQINGGAVTTVGTQTYNDTLVFGAATSLNTTNSAVTAVGVVTATAGILTLATGAGDITMSNAANNFGTVAVTSGKNVTLRDSNALDLGTSNITGTLAVTTAGAITQSGAVAVTGVSTLAAGAANNITLNNIANDFGTVLVTSGNNVTVNDKNVLTVGAVNAKGNVLFQTAVGAGNDITLVGNILSTAGGITLASGEDINYGTNTLTSALRWLTYSVNPVNDAGTIPSTGNSKPNIYNSTFAALGSGVVLPGTGNHHVYSTQPTLTYTANAASRTYGVANPAFSGSVAGLVNGDVAVDAFSGTPTFSSTATLTSNVGSYDITGAGLISDIGYKFAQAPANATAFTINPATLTYTANAANRLYGAADPVFSGGIGGFVLGENQGTATTGTLSFSTPAVANSNVGSYALNGSGLAANNGNYIFIQAPANATAFSINPAIINLTGNRAYDATVAFASSAFGTAGTISTGIGGQTLIVAGGPGSVASANVAAGVQTLALGGLALSDGTGLASNYTLVSGTHTGTVTGKTVNVAASRVYDATNSFTAGGFTPTITGTVGGETLSIAGGSGAVLSANVAAGTQTLTLGTLALGDGSGLAGNYILAGGTHTGAVTAKSLTASITGTPTKIYDGNTSANLTPGNYSLSGFVGVEGATVTQTAGTYNSKDVLTANNVGATLVSADFTAVGGTLLSNYNLPLNASGAGAITPAMLTGNVTAANRIYDATTLATLTGRTLTGVVGADTVIYSGGIAAFADKNAGVGKVVTATGLSLTGADAGNYVVNTTAVTTANIAQAAIANVTGIAADSKGYDATATAALNAVTAGFTGLFAGDVLTVAGVTGSFVDKNVANGKTVNISGITLGGADAGNYTLTTNTATATANITPAAIASVTGISANNKVYDTTTVAVLNTAAAGFTGLYAGDVLTVAAASGAFADKNAAIGKTVNVSGITLGGADAGNYTLTTNTATATANVTPAAIGNVTGITANHKIYDATTTATLSTVTAGFNGLLAGDVLTVAGVTGSFADKNVANGKTVNIGGITLGGADSGNYTLTTNTATASANITPAAIASVTGISANNKVYDATTAATLNSAGAVFVGSIGADMLTVASATAAFADKNAANGKTVNISGITLAGADAGNYTLTSNTATAAANITPATLNVSYVGVNKVYDGATTATVNASDNRLGADVLTINRTASFNDANAASGKSVNVTGVNLAGADAGNYVVATTGIATADITARGITVAANNAAKVYGNTDPTLMFNVGGAGLAAGDTITGVITGALARAPGENVAGSPYAINQGSLASNSNYNITAFTPGPFLITPRALTIAADNKSSLVGNPLPLFTATYTGLALTDSAASLTGALAFATAATQASPPGLYAVAPSGQSSGNYVLTYVNGVLTVQSGASLIPNDVFAAINSGASQLPPPFLSGPFIGGPQALSTNLFATMQPSNVTGGAPDALVRAEDILVAPGAGEPPSNGEKPGTDGENRRLLSGAVKHLVNIINGGVKLPNPSDIIAQGSGAR